MEETAQLCATTGLSISAILAGTMAIWAPHLLQNKGSIEAVPASTHSYGSHPRQTLDIYLPPITSSSSPSSPILIFLYGGGLIFGSKIITQIPENLVYANLGAFFATRGITTVIPDYRLVNSPFGGHDAVFPSGGDDVAAVLRFLEKQDGFKGRDVYLMGNSAGGVHVSTFLLHPSYLTQRKEYASPSGGLHLKGVIELAVPCHFKCLAPHRAAVLKTYYGSSEAITDNSPCGLLESISAKTLEEAALTKVLALVGELDPVDEIVDPMNDFVALWKKKFGEKDVQSISMAGHNHISPPLALMAGDVQGEKWGELVAAWILS